MKLSKEKKRAILSFLLPYLIYAVMRIFFLTYKKTYIIKAKKEDLQKPYILAFWHNRIWIQPFTYNHISREKPLSTIVSPHFDGSLVAGVMKLFGFNPILGSSNKGGIEVLKKAFRHINEGKNIAITPDGPRGPKGIIADGIVAISQKKDTPILPVNYKANKFWTLNTWDDFIIPKPFSKIDIYVNPTFKVTNMDREEAKDLITKKLGEL